MLFFYHHLQEQSTEIALPEAALKHLPFHLLLYGAPMKVIGRDLLRIKSLSVDVHVNTLAEAELLSPANVEKLMPISRILQVN